tara:strand:- start:222 stop:911 length:690 start_codon:yes stop_codon:yes gene_type:complete
MRKILQNLANSSHSFSLANKFRRKRIEVFKKFIEDMDLNEINILDVGGTPVFWKNMMIDKKHINLKITLLNLDKLSQEDNTFIYVQGDAIDLGMFSNKQFDLVFSNSVIEHVCGENGVTFLDQQKMANEIQRVGKRFYVQTPNYWFPIEPHFLCPFFQYFPTWIKAFLLRSFNLGWYSKISDKDESFRVAKSIRLLTLEEMNKLFPNSFTFKEKFYGLNKSFTKFGDSI